MKPLGAGSLLPEEVWQAVRLQTIFGCCKWDVQSEDQCVLARFPLQLAQSEWRRLANRAEALSTEALAAEQEIMHREELHGRLGLPRGVRKALRHFEEPDRCMGAARVMRFDFHFTDQGWRVSEVNADVPGGFIEASGFTELMSAAYGMTTAPPNPAQAYAEAVFNATHPGALVGLVHATGYTDDRQVMEYISSEIRARGMKTCMLSPAHLQWRTGRAQITCNFATGWPDLLVRFFPADWLPNLGDRNFWWGYFRGGQTPMSNPGSALLIQTKRFPLVWDDLATPLPTWRALMPETRCPGEASDLWSGDWVLKPALGRVGEGVTIPGVSRVEQLAHVKLDVRLHPSAWVAQRRFQVIPVNVEGQQYYPCLGIFTVDGRAAGAYGRVAKKRLIDGDAQDAAVLLCEGDLS